MIRYHAAWVLPIEAPPLAHGWVDVDGGRIVGYGADPGGARRGALGTSEVDLGAVALLPGLVNAHTHLELSYLRDQVPSASTFVDWIRSVVAFTRQRSGSKTPPILDGVERAVAECLASGTVLVGDISNTLVTFDALARSALAGMVFYELIRFNAPDPEGFVARACREIDALAATDRVRASLAAHAPYSVAPDVLRAIARRTREKAAPCSIHLAESVEEVEFVGSGGGPWRKFLEDVGAWDPSWAVPGVSPVEFVAAAGVLDQRVLVVHGVQMTREDLRVVAASGATLVTCPRSNRRTGAGVPPIADFYDSGARVAVGTDSLASTPDLNLFTELATMREVAPHVPARQLLASATVHGATALGFEADYGTLAAGRRARLVAVEAPGAIADVEEYLVSGISPEQVRWVE